MAAHDQQRQRLQQKNKKGKRVIAWTWHSFADLASSQLYDALQLRELVFTIGQKCSDPDLDDVDRRAVHMLGYDDSKLVGYLRIYEKNHRQNLGRIVVAPDRQGQGIGREMMLVVIAHLQKENPGQIIEMSAQYYLEKFYQSLGFVSEGEVYLEAGIPHVRMQLVNI